MSYKPNSPQGAKYPTCMCCNNADEAVYVADPLKLDDQNQAAFNKLPKNATQQQYKDAFTPALLCAPCAEQKKVALIGELPWPPPVDARGVAPAPAPAPVLARGARFARSVRPVPVAPRGAAPMTIEPSNASDSKKGSKKK